MLCEVPLTKEQQAFATDHHGLVYKFLNENHLPEDEFYDVVVFAYLKAVKDYFNSPSAQKFSFSTIATRQMKFRLYDYFRTQERRKRNMEVLSIHVGLYPDGAPLEDTIPAHDPIMQQLEMDLLLHELAGRVSKQQMDIVHLKQGGYAAFQRQDIDEIESLALALRKEIEAALQPFYMGHMCLYVTPECFDDPPKTPEVYNDATACVWRDGTWQLLEDTSKGFLLFVQSKSKEETAA